MKPKEFKVNTIEDFQKMVDDKTFSISEALVTSILNNLKTRKKNIHLISIKCTNENEEFDVTLEKRYFVETLKENLKYYEEREMYEECSKINKAIANLTKSK
jgi:hypothetical protein